MLQVNRCKFSKVLWNVYLDNRLIFPGSCSFLPCLSLSFWESLNRSVLRWNVPFLAKSHGLKTRFVNLVATTFNKIFPVENIRITAGEKFPSSLAPAVTCVQRFRRTVYKHIQTNSQSGVWLSPRKCSRKLEIKFFTITNTVRTSFGEKFTFGYLMIVALLSSLSNLVFDTLCYCLHDGGNTCRYEKDVKREYKATKS